MPTALIYGSRRKSMAHLIKSRWFERLLILLVLLAVYTRNEYYSDEKTVPQPTLELTQNTKQVNGGSALPVIDNEVSITSEIISPEKLDKWQVIEPEKHTEDDTVVINIGEYIDVDSNVFDDSDTDEVVNIGEFIDVDEDYITDENQETINIGPILDVDAKGSI